MLKPEKYIHVGYNAVIDIIGLAVVASQICKILRNSLKIRTYTVQGHRSWCQQKAHMQLPITH